MLKGKVRRGFFFYIGFFLLLILAFVGICVTIMIFNPGKDVLGFKFYRNSGANEILRTTGTNSELNLDTQSYSEIQINAGIADVIIENNNNYDHHSIVAVNNTKGFAKSSSSQDYEVSVVTEGSKLIVDIQMNKGFLNFSNDAKVILHIARKADFTNFTNTALKVVTTSGSVVVGGEVNVGYSEDIFMKSLDIETGSGNITLTKHANNSYSTIDLKTSSGIINLNDKTSSEDKANNLEARNGDVNISLGNGKLRAGMINDTVSITANEGLVEIEEIEGDLIMQASKTNIIVKKVTGSVNFEKGQDTFKSAKVTIDEIGGNLNIPQAQSSEIVVKKVSGDVNVHTTSGSVTLGNRDNLLSGIIYVATESGSIKAYFGDTDEGKFLISEKGNIEANYLGSVRGTSKLLSNEGEVKVNFRSYAKIRFTFNNASQGKLEDYDLSHVKFDILNGRKLSDNPYYRNTTVSGSDVGKINIISNKDITLDLI